MSAFKHFMWKLREEFDCDEQRTCCFKEHYRDLFSAVNIRGMMMMMMKHFNTTLKSWGRRQFFKQVYKTLRKPGLDGLGHRPYNSLGLGLDQKLLNNVCTWCSSLQSNIKIQWCQQKNLTKQFENSAIRWRELMRRLSVTKMLRLVDK